MSPSPVKRNFRVRKNPESFHHGDLREAAIHLAVKDVETRGHTHVSLERLAKNLGVTRPALYRHFADRDALLEAAALRGLERFEKALEAPLLLAPDPWRAIHDCGYAYVRFAWENPGWFRLQFSREQTERRPSHLMTRRPAYAPLLLKAVSDKFGNDNPETDDVFRVLWAEVHGLAVLVVERVFQLVDTDTERLVAAERAISILVEAFHAYSKNKVGRLGLAPSQPMPGFSSLVKGKAP